MNEKTGKWVRRFIIFFITLLSMLILAWLYPYYDHVLLIIGRVCLPFVIALVLSLILHPLVRYLERVGIPRLLAILIIFTIFFTSATFAIYKGYPRLLAQLKLLNEHLPELVQSYQDWTKEFHAQTERLPDGIHKKLNDTFSNLEEGASERIMSLLTGISGLFNIVVLAAVIPVMTFYFLKDYKVLGRSILSVLPRSWHEESRRLVTKLNHSLGGYIRGQLLVSVFVGILASAGFWLIDLPYPLVLGLVAGATNIIPYFGPLLGAVPAVIVALTISVKLLIYSLLVVIIIQLIEGNLLSPYIMGRSIHIHPIFIILALLAGGELAGVVGLILAVPVLTCLKVVVSEIRNGRLNIDR
ncbi:AI-2E family transporter [Halobacillus yeomjeoni]|uniref:AI-2E family transporter n=1 Tax=Halobacillus yeomjeoni TaxID=311194 RepID=UPI001CD34086|nr:AI-2E family transporter [Halobacillus yeomjeoni]MCA0982655.1 AI-2E family transporter [Halobacillus yeomjeoni]